MDWELIRQRNQVQINKDNIRKNRHRVDYDYIVGDNIMLTNHTAYKYETPHKGPFVITLFFTNGTVKFQNVATQITYNIRHINPYKPDTKVEYSNSINMCASVDLTSKYFLPKLIIPVHT